MLAAGRESFYGVQDGRDTYWDIASKSVKPVQESSRTLRVEYLERGNKKIARNDSASPWDMGDGVPLLEFHSKMNSIDDDIIAMMNKAPGRGGEEPPGPGDRQRRARTSRRAPTSWRC